jgi:hypothetical protein
MSNNEYLRNDAKGCTPWFPIRIMLGMVIALAPMAASAQSTTLYVQPKFLFNDSRTPAPIRGTLGAAWADVQAADDYCNIAGTCYSVLNLHPVEFGDNQGVTFDGIVYQQYYDQQICPDCITNPDWGAISTSNACPAGASSAGYYNSPSKI